MILGGENGLLYDIKLNTKFDKANKKISLNPQVLKYSYEIKGNNYQGIAYIKKINGVTGKSVFEKKYRAMSLLGDEPVNGGVLATNVIGKGDIKDQIIFTIARYKEFNYIF